MSTDFRSRLKAGETLLGTLIGMPSSEATEIMANLGFDWLFIDMEHGAFDPLTAQRMLQAAGPCPCVIRVPGIDEVSIKKAWDVGASGLIIPQVNTAAEAKRVVELCKYPPLGRRGIGPARSNGYGYDLAKAIAEANNETAVIVQAEHFEAVENIAEIVAVSGVDAILIGPFDLSTSMGKVGQLQDAEVAGAINKVREACQAVGMPVGIFGVGAEAVLPYMEQGFSLIVAGADVIFLSQMGQATLEKLR